MQIAGRATVSAVLFLSLSSCSAAGSLFSIDSTPSTARTAAAEVQPASSDESCAHIAAERADDAVLAFYVTEGSSEQQDIYRATYRDCVSWHDH